PVLDAKAAGLGQRFGLGFQEVELSVEFRGHVFLALNSCSRPSRLMANSTMSGSPLGSAVPRTTYCTPAMRSAMAKCRPETMVSAGSGILPKPKKPVVTYQMLRAETVRTTKKVK